MSLPEPGPGRPHHKIHGDPHGPLLSLAELLVAVGTIVFIAAVAWLLSGAS